MWHQVGRQSRRPDWVTFLTFCPQPPSCPQLIQLEQDHRLFQDPREGRIPEFHQNPLSVEAVAASLLCARSFVDLPVPEEVQLQHWCSQRGGGQVDWMKTSPRGGRWKESSCPHPSICHPHLQTDCCGPTPCTGANITDLNSATGQTLRCLPVSVNERMMGRFHAFPDLLSISICTFSLTKAARWLASRDLYSVNKSQMLETAYGTCCLPMHRQQAECDLTPGALSEPHNMQLYHPYSGRGRPRRRQSSCCGRGLSVSSAHWQRKWLSFCLPAPTGSRNGVKTTSVQTNVHVCIIWCKVLSSLTTSNSLGEEERKQNTIGKT